MGLFGAVRAVAYKIWRGMQENYITFRIALWLKKHGFNKIAKKWLIGLQDMELRRHPSEQMIMSQKFYKENRERIHRLMSLFSDDMSRKVWGGVFLYRMKRTPLNRELYLPEEEQYFVRDIVRIEDGEVFIDGGAYTGDTIRQLLKMAKTEKVKIRKIVAFEPSPKNCRILKETCGTNNRIEIINMGMSDKKGMLLFCENGNVTRITEDASQATSKLPVTSIDAEPCCQDATWIKMDIEGAELDALRGAENVIRRNHPKLTICTYHSDEHMCSIAEYIHELVPEYRIYIRHHTSTLAETVLYAVI